MAELSLLVLPSPLWGREGMGVSPQLFRNTAAVTPTPGPAPQGGGEKM